MKILKCVACGGNELKRHGNICVCSYCGSKYTLDESDNMVSEELTEAKIITLLVNSSKLHEEENYAKELEVLFKAYEMDKSNSDITVKLGRCYRALGLPDKAIEYYKRTLELNPNEGTAYTNMGTIYILREDYEEAAKCYEKGLPMIDKATSDYWIGYANYALVIGKLGDLQKADKMIKEAEVRGYTNGDATRKLIGIKPKSFVSKIKTLFS